VSESALPKVGDKIPANKFFVSKTNVRVDEEFGVAEQDETLSQHLVRRDIVQPFIARPEGNRYGVVIGRRRYLGKKRSGVKEFEVGKDCYIKNMTDEEALDASLRENLEIFRKDMNPITRAKALNKVIQLKVTGIRGLARLWRVPNSTLVEWLKVLELSPKMQDVVAKGLIYYVDALRLARLKLGEDLQDKLAETVESEGLDGFRKEMERLQAGRKKRGIPKGKYIILRTVFDRRYKPDIDLWERLEKLAEAKGKKVDEYCKDVLKDHVKAAS